MDEQDEGRGSLEAGDRQDESETWVEVGELSFHSRSSLTRWREVELIRLGWVGLGTKQPTALIIAPSSVCYNWERELSNVSRPTLHTS